ncbi:hypothetical protein FA95DRAFT_227151 [Auriscalpium vulgare]|uniref:Uncharacterized protein n=1 Tax=Auriscalpium vulgare TaxID=40419 RepID=A0ACB8RM19_9AGAM|nr:hypothetical protein FA95DRAFT_227151 [Auriscalpium vulgare]
MRSTASPQRALTARPKCRWCLSPVLQRVQATYSKFLRAHTCILSNSDAAPTLLRIRRTLRRDRRDGRVRRKVRVDVVRGGVREAWQFSADTLPQPP